MCIRDRSPAFLVAQVLPPSPNQTKFETQIRGTAILGQCCWAGLYCLAPDSTDAQRVLLPVGLYIRGVRGPQ
eukprot:623143-Rhodomonas_salina.1